MLFWLTVFLVVRVLLPRFFRRYRGCQRFRGSSGRPGAEGLMSVELPRVLIGGLGLGFTLKTVLGSLGMEARVDVAELLPTVGAVDTRRFIKGLVDTH